MSEFATKFPVELFIVNPLLEDTLFGYNELNLKKLHGSSKPTKIELNLYNSDRE